ncbi:hypothetical protein DV532_26650 (plasmid) [Pseudomonas sp. Leaf58]|nr:hypothetical protein DV532_26650 [Pseudomonas sp. Leaf58]KQN62569.1 hypothetical protein ASF02_10510 [Pseudomonas sp. Leaf58]
MFDDPLRLERVNQAPGKYYAQAHLEGALYTELIWPLLKALKIEQRPSYTQHLCKLSGIFSTSVNPGDVTRRKRGFAVLKEALDDRMLAKRVVFDLRAPWVQALQIDQAGGLHFLSVIQGFGTQPFMDFLLRTVMPERCPGFVEAINAFVNRESVIASIADTAYFDRLHAIYGWPELTNLLSERGMASMLECDLGL